jgi:hypothetical protein
MVLSALDAQAIPRARNPKGRTPEPVVESRWKPRAAGAERPLRDDRRPTIEIPIHAHGPPFVAICCLHLKAFYAYKPYPLAKPRFCVREVVAARMRNIRVKCRHDGRRLVQSATASNPKTVRVRAPTVSASNPRPCIGRDCVRAANVRMQPVSSNYPCPGRICAGFTSGSA